MPLLSTDKLISPAFNIITSSMPRIFEQVINLVAPFKDANGDMLCEGSIVKTPNGFDAILRYGPYHAPDELSRAEDSFMHEGWGWYLEVGATQIGERDKLAYYNHVPCCSETAQALVCLGHINTMHPPWWSAFEEFTIKAITNIKVRHPDKTLTDLAASEGFTDLFIPHCHVCGDAFEDDVDAPKRYAGKTADEAWHYYLTYHICLNCLTQGKEKIDVSR